MFCCGCPRSSTVSFVALWPVDTVELEMESELVFGCCVIA